MGVDTIGGRITQARLEEGARRGKAYTQTELARGVGVSPQAISQAEADTSVPSLGTIMRIAKLLHREPAWIAWGDRTDIIIVDETEG